MTYLKRVFIGLSLASFTFLSTQAIAQTKATSLTIAQNQSDRGVENFINDPTLYGFACGDSPGKVKGASINGNEMVIEYEYPSGDEMRTGKLIGQIDSAGEFRGTYNTNTNKGLVQGEIALSFTDDGTADGNYRNVLGTVSIFKN